MTTIPAAPETSNELITLDEPLETLSLPVLLAEEGGLDSLVAKIKERALAVPTDMTTAAGRKAVISLGEKVRKSRIFLEKQIKEHTDKIKAELKTFGGRTEKMSASLNDLILEIQKPVKDFEEAEAKRKETRTKAIFIIRSLGNVPPTFTAAEIEARITELRAEDPMDWQEFAEEAQAAKDTSVMLLQQRLEQVKATEALAEENRKQAERIKELEAQQQPEPPRQSFSQVAQQPVFTATETPTPAAPASSGVQVPAAGKFGYATPVTAHGLNEKRQRAYELFESWFKKEMNMYEGDIKFIFTSLELGEIPHATLNLEKA